MGLPFLRGQHTSSTRLSWALSFFTAERITRSCDRYLVLYSNWFCCTRIENIRPTAVHPLYLILQNVGLYNDSHQTNEPRGERYGTQSTTPGDPTVAG